VWTTPGVCVQAALLAAFIGHEGWGLQHGWNSTSADPCGDAASARWEGITCVGGGVTKIDLASKQSVRGELGPALGKLPALERLCATQPLSVCCSTVGPGDRLAFTFLPYLGMLPGVGLHGCFHA